MARRAPDGGARDDARVQAVHVLAPVHEVAPPQVLDVLLELAAERAVVVEPVEAVVDLARAEDEAALAAELHDLVHRRALHLRGVEARPGPPRAARRGLQRADRGQQSHDAAHASCSLEGGPEASDCPTRTAPDLHVCATLRVANKLQARKALQCAGYCWRRLVSLYASNPEAAGAAPTPSTIYNLEPGCCLLVYTDR